jgi:DnaJ-domain-containing protein 1
MIPTPELAALEHALALCSQHEAGLTDALDDLGQCGLEAADLDRLGKDTRRLLDPFAYRYTRLRDDMGARLFPTKLRAAGEDVAPMSVLDRLARLEQLGCLPSADQWIELRRIRNEVTHDHPDTLEERFLRLQLAIQAARHAMSMLAGIRDRMAASSM